MARQLRREGLCGRTVHLKVRTGDFTTWTRSVTLPQPVDLAEPLLAAAREMFRERIKLGGKGVRLLGLGVSGLDNAGAGHVKGATQRRGTQTGSSHIHPGPLTHDGLLLEPQDPADGETTIALVERMIADLTAANETSDQTGGVQRSVLAETWHDDMIWYGPEGIGATYTIDRYQQQHQFPFRFNLADKVFNGHVARFAEGDYACFFGWANLTNTPTGGFLGMPGSGAAADMRVVDVYRRDGDKLAENWVFIDLLHWLHMQGLDVLARMRQLTGQEEL